jgi:16S rRNA (cytosine967-C5)-methyltransferase
LKREEIKKHAGEQLKLLEDVHGHLYPKGYLVYSTCSLEREENQEVIQIFLNSHTGWDMAVPEAPPEVSRLIKDKWGVTFLPTEDRDGGFLSVLQKNRN